MSLYAKLERTKVDEQTWNFSLVVQGDLEKTFYLARIKNGSMTLVNYEVKQIGGRDVLSAFFYVNIMGHDLDEWMHFDLAAGEQISLDGSKQPAMRAPIETEWNEVRRPGKRLSVDKIRAALEKWGRKP